MLLPCIQTTQRIDALQKGLWVMPAAWRMPPCTSLSVSVMLQVTASPPQNLTEISGVLSTLWQNRCTNFCQTMPHHGRVGCNGVYFGGGRRVDGWEVCWVCVDRSWGVSSWLIPNVVLRRFCVVVCWRRHQLQNHTKKELAITYCDVKYHWSGKWV